MNGIQRKVSTEAFPLIAVALLAGALSLAPAAHAGPDTGTYDEIVEVHGDGGLVTSIPGDDGYGARDTGSSDEMIEVHDGGSVTFMQDDDGLQADNVVNSTTWGPGSVTGH